MPAPAVAGPDGLQPWLAQLPQKDGIYLLSKPAYFGNQSGAGEDDYVQQFAHDGEAERRIAAGLTELLAGCDASAPALEIGAGTGILSRPLVAQPRYPAFYITDTSPTFLRMTRASLEGVQLRAPVEYVVLSGDEIDRWPAASVSLVIVRYTLHHVLDWEGFISAAARLLVPGGALAFEEPCADGFILQAALVDVVRRMPAVARELSEAVRKDLEFMVGTTYFYANSSVDKSRSEDKHVFAQYRLLQECSSAGLVGRLYPNTGLEGGFDPAGHGPADFAHQMRHNLAVNFGFGPDTLAFYDEYIAPVAAEVGSIGPHGGGPIVRGVVLATKPG